jgi:predicted ABC-type ATPase
MDFEGRENLLDPDAVARSINASDPTDAAISAARSVLTRTHDYLVRGTSFAVETTLSGRGTLKLMAEAQSNGYKIHLIFIYSLRSALRRNPSHGYEQEQREANTSFPMSM